MNKIDNNKLFSPCLSIALSEGNLNHSSKLKDDYGVYFIMFRVLKKNSNIIVYNYFASFK